MSDGSEVKGAHRGGRAPRHIADREHAAAKVTRELAHHEHACEARAGSDGDADSCARRGRLRAAPWTSADAPPGDSVIFEGGGQVESHARDAVAPLCRQRRCGVPVERYEVIALRELGCPAALTAHFLG